MKNIIYVLFTILLFVFCCTTAREEFIDVEKKSVEIVTDSLQQPNFAIQGTTKVPLQGVLVESLVVGNISEAIYSGRWYTLSVEVLPHNATNQLLHFSSSNTDYARVENGRFYIVPNSPYSDAVITISATDGSGVKASIRLWANIPVEEVVIPIGSLTLAVGQERAILANVYPQGAKKGVLWESSNEQVASISAEGVVRTHTEGLTYIKARSQANQQIYDAVRVTVIAPADRIEIEEPTIQQRVLYLKVGTSTSLALSSHYRQKQTSFFGADSFKRDLVYWLSSDRTIAEVTPDWLLHAKKEGEVDIKVNFHSYNNVLTQWIRVIISQ